MSDCTICRKCSVRIVRAGLFFLIFTGAISSAFGQGPVGTRTVPREDYFLSFQPFYDGDYRTAGKTFQLSAKSGVRVGVNRWVDSICYHTMMGECHYQMGQLPLALEQYDAALRLYLSNPNWMLRVKFPATIRQMNSARARTINWGQSQRNVRMGQFPDTMVSLQGTNAEQALRQGGVVASPNYYPLNVKEIVRCMALAVRRRAELMGPTCSHSALTGQLLSAMARKPVPPNHWSSAWASAHLGLAYYSAGRDVEAVSELQNSLVVAGRFDHPLTATALLTLGRISLEQGNHDVAGNYFLEATYSAALFGDYDVVREAFELGYVAFRASGKQGVYPPLARAPAWARRNSRALQAGLLVLAAESYSAAGDLARAGQTLDLARRAMLRRDLQNGMMGARLKYLTALLNYQTGNVAVGDVAFRSAMAYQKNGSRRLFQVALADHLYTTDAVTDRVAMDLFDKLLDDPKPLDWTLDPMETLSVLTNPRLMAMEHWFEVAMKRKEFDRALEISDQVRRHRFYSTLPMGGRLLSLRWILEAPEASLSATARLQRQDLLLKYPQYAGLSRLAKPLRAKLRQLPMIAGEDAAARKQQESLYDDLTQHSAAQELMLRAIALKRDPGEFVFPPARTFKEYQQRVGEREIVLSFFSTNTYVFAFAFSKGKYANWRVEGTAKLKRQVAALLKQIGQVEKNQPIRASNLRDPKWKAMAQSIFSGLTKQFKPEAWDNFDQLVIIPDGMLWYVPFQSLQLKHGDTTVPLISKVRVRLVPTVSLAHPDGRGRLADAQTAVVWGQLFPKGDEPVLAGAWQQLAGAAPNAVRLPTVFSTPSRLFKTRCDRLLMMRDIDEKARGVYGWSPMQYDRGKPGASLLEWFELPWGGPRQMIIPGFHTPAEDAMRRGGTGAEVFLSVCGLMSTGTRTLLLSRWRVGGQSSQDLVREFTQELPHTSAADAWQRSVEVVRNNGLNPDLEPRLKLDDNGVEQLKADHPFFWSGYMLIDTGSAPK